MIIDLALHAARISAGKRNGPFIQAPMIALGSAIPVSEAKRSGPNSYEVYRAGQWISLPVVGMQREERV